ncbi:MAG: ATP-binding protein, partial [Pseudobutyrivibrio sp.]|nr:ATP-binding protein [Pseudobutyrivibrio sp.]
YQLACKNNCHFSFNGAISPNISAFSICTILANTLDNSIEACAKIKTENDRFIAIDCVVNNNIQIITVTNSIKSINHNLKTTKNNPSEHGIGLYSIRRTVESLNGTLKITQKSNTFTLDIVFVIQVKA